MPVIEYQPEVAPKIVIPPFVPTQYQVRPSSGHPCERRAYDRFPRLIAPYIIRSSFITFTTRCRPTKPLIDTPHFPPTDRRLYRRYLRRVEHTSRQERDQPI